MHAPDPDAIPITSEEARAYDAEAMRLGADAPRPLRTLAYGPDRAQRLDVYAPLGARGLPILLFFHGGAWVSGHRGWLRFMAEPALAAGFVLGAGGYRLAPRCRWPAQEEDVRVALAYVHEHALALGGDPDRIVIGGHSAGGHLASLVAVKGGRALLAAFPVACSFDLRYGDVPLESDQGRTYRYLFARREQDADASPIAFVTPDAPPFHVVWGERDLDRVADSSRRMVDALASARVPVTHDIMPGASHFDAHLALADPAHPWYRRLRAAVSAPIRRGRRRMNAPTPLLQFTQALRSGAVRVVDLTQPLSPDTPALELPPQFGQCAGFSQREVSRYDERGVAWYWNEFTMNEHTGTHFDAPVHWVTGRDHPDGSVDALPPRDLIAPAVVLDFSAEAAADPDFLLTRAQIERWEAEHARIEPGSWILFRTDWSKRSGDAYTNRQEDGAHTPGPDVEAVRFLVDERGVLGFGVETIGTDAGQAHLLDPPYPAHHFLHGAGRYGLQCLANLDQLPTRGAVVIAAPLKIVGGSGSPLRVLALVPGEA